MTNHITQEIHWFMQTLKDDFDVKVSAEEISVEATELGLSEVEGFFVPSELFEVVPDIPVPVTHTTQT